MIRSKHLKTHPLLVVLFSVLLFHSDLVSGQKASKFQIEQWMRKQKLRVNSPDVPLGFTLKKDCKKKPVYRKESGDTIFMYTWAISYLLSFEEFKAVTQDSVYNVTHIPTQVLPNGQVKMHRLTKKTFLFRNDTLYQYDEENREKAMDKYKLLLALNAKKITQQEYDAGLAKIEQKVYDFKPQFKAIYFLDMFEAVDSYTFNQLENFREERFHKEAKFEKEGRIIVEMSLDRGLAKYRFSRNMQVLETCNCSN